MTTSYDEAAPKRLELLREILPNAALIGVLVNPNIPSPRAVKRLIRTAARSVGQRVEILQAGTERDIDTVFARMIDMRVDALLVAPHALFATRLSNQSR